MTDKRILLIIGGGIAAYKSLFLIRVLAKRGIASRVIITRGGTEFVTPLSAGALSGDKVYSDLWDLTDEAEMGHIELSRSADLVVVAPATADIMAKAAHGIANDLATTTLLATDKRVLYAPAMNVRMWEAAAAVWQNPKRLPTPSKRRLRASPHWTRLKAPNRLRANQPSSRRAPRASPLTLCAISLTIVRANKAMPLRVPLRIWAQM